MSSRRQRWRRFLGVAAALALVAALGGWVAASRMVVWPPDGPRERLGRDPAPPIDGPLRRGGPWEPYFVDANGRGVYLAGSHTWTNFQDGGRTDPPPAFDYGAYLDRLVAWNHDFVRLWRWEQSSTTVATDGAEPWFAPLPYARTGPGLALDGKPRFDLTRFDPGYFARLRERVVAAGDRGIYVAVMLFNGFGVESKGRGRGNPWAHHPFHARNNVNGVDGDRDGDGEGLEVHGLAVPEVTALQEAYVRKVVETLHDLDNVLYEISNESHAGSDPWQRHMIEVVRKCDREFGVSHPVGMTVEYPGGDNRELFEGPADWVSPNTERGDYRRDPPAADGAKVVVTDTDHLWGVGGDHHWVWRSFTRGLNPIFMDPYDDATRRSGVFRADPDLDASDPRWQRVRDNLGYTRTVAGRLDLRRARPEPTLCSTGFCLRSGGSSGAAFVVYVPWGRWVTLDLSGSPEAFRSEWIDPLDGSVLAGRDVVGGGFRAFGVPRTFADGAVLFVAPRSAGALPRAPGSGGRGREGSRG